MPLHPMAVHFPIVFAFLLPAAIAGVIVVRRFSDSRSAWVCVVALAAALTFSSFVAAELGEMEEDRVEKVVGARALEEHHGRAEIFTWLTVATLVIVSTLTYKRNRALKAAAVVASVVTLAFAIQTGHSGGELVYKHNAARAYGADPLPAGGERSSEDGHEHRH